MTEPGNFVLLSPRRHAFAISSGSLSGQPSNKERPCLFVGYTNRGNAAIVPLCGAHFDRTSQLWGPRLDASTCIHSEIIDERAETTILL
jgi:hypothetical protein